MLRSVRRVLLQGVKATAKSPVDYETLNVDQLEGLLSKRVDQIKELREIHEKTHWSVEKAYRKQILDYDEKSFWLSTSAGKMETSQTAWHREDLKKVREVDETKGRDEALCAFFWFVVNCYYWYYCIRHYPLKHEIAESRPTFSANKMVGPITFASYGGFFSRHIDTEFERELKERKKKEAAEREAAYKL